MASSEAVDAVKLKIAQFRYNQVTIKEYMEPGTVVEYIDQQRVICAAVLEAKDERLRLLNENSREVSQKLNRLSHVSGSRIKLSQGRDHVAESLKAIAGRRQALSRHIDIREIWEALCSLEEWVDLPTMTSFCFSGDVNSDQESAVIRAFFENRIYFKFSHDLFYPHPEDVVENNIARQKAEERQKKLVEEGGQWLRSVINNGSPPPQADAGVVDILKSYYLYGKESQHQTKARAILARAGADSADVIFSAMVRSGYWDRHENLDIYRYDISVDFPAPVMEEVSLLHDRGEQKIIDPARRDLTDLDIMTIDGQGTMDYDDALSVQAAGKNLRVGVHISDVAQWVEKGGIIDREVLFRGTSIYMPDLKIPMLPAGMAEDLCSLIKDRKRPAISIFFTVTPHGEVVEYEIVPSVISVKHQLTYSDVDNVAQTDERIRALYAAALGFKKKRLENGAVQILLPELHVRVCGTDDIRVRVLDRESPGRLLVAEMMIMANWVMARFLAENQMPAIFRAQNQPRGRLYSGMDEGTLFQNWMQRRMLSRVILSTEPEPHSGLGLDAYTTATSPIRKYFDLVTQRQVRACLGMEEAYSSTEIEEMLQSLQAPLTNARLVQNRRMRFWILKYLENMTGTKTEAIVLDKRRDGYTILLTDYLMEARLPVSAGMELRPKDLVQITFQHVDAARDKLAVYLG